MLKSHLITHIIKIRNYIFFNKQKFFNKIKGFSTFNLNVLKFIAFAFFIFFTFSLCFLSFANFLHADVSYPEYTSFVNDYAGVLGFEWEDRIESICAQVEEKTSAEIAVAVIDSLQEITIEEYAVKLFEKWKIGKAKEDNGVLLLVAISDGELRIEVGYGLEGTITDLEAGDIINDVIVPYFKQGDYEKGIYEGVAAIANEIYKEYGVGTTIETSPIKKTGFFESLDSFLKNEQNVCFFCCIPIFLIGAISSAISSILRRKCPKCKKLKLKIKQAIIQQPTYSSTGKMLETRTCSSCGYSDQKVVTLPKKGSTSSGGFYGGGSSGGFSGGSRGGGFGGFGGGFSGGGGASGRW